MTDERPSRSRDALNEFLAYLERTGLASRTAVQGRRVAVNKILGVLGDEEVEDVASIDLDAVARRFLNLNPSKYKPHSIRAYISRTRAAIADFSRYVENPGAYKPLSPRGETRRRRNVAAAESASAEQSSSEATGVHPASQVSRALPSAALSIPIPIRDDVLVTVRGVPYDLTESEAKKISAVITALSDK